MKFGLFFVGEYIGIVTISALMVTLFFGGWQGPLLPPFIWFALKTAFFMMMFILIRASLPRPRYDQVMSFGWKNLPAADADQLAATAAVILWQSAIRGNKTMTLKELLVGFGTQVRSIWMIGLHAFAKRETRMYPEEPVYLPPRYRGRIVLTRDPDGEERCVACNLCAVACPVGCISLQKAETKDGRWYPEFFPHQLLTLHFLWSVRRSLSDHGDSVNPGFRNGGIQAPGSGLRERGSADLRSGQIPGI